jgi:hypothetical protein
MGIWIELGVFALAFVFAIHQFHDLKKERLKREKAREQGLKRSKGDGPPDPNQDR